MFESIDDVQSALSKQSYFADRAIATSVFLASKLGKPLLETSMDGFSRTV